MRRFIVSTLAAVVASVLVVGLASGSASAQTRSFKDKSKDAPARVDIIGWKVTSKAKSYTTKITLRRHKKGRAAVGFIVASPDQTRGYAVVAFPKGVEVARYSKAQRKYVKASCRGAKVKRSYGRKGSVTIKVPRRCIKQIRGTKSFTSPLTQDLKLKNAFDRGTPRPVRRG